MRNLSTANLIAKLLVRQQQASTAANSEETSCQKRNSSNPLEKDSQIQKLSDEGGESPQQNSSRPPSKARSVKRILAS